MDSRPLVELVAMTDRLRSAFRQGPRQLGLALGLSVPDGWPEYPDALLSAAVPGWPFFLFVDSTQASILGSGGFLCAPDDKNEVQVGYEVAPIHRGRGVATHAMQQVLAAHTSAVPVAVTQSETGPSVSVLRKLGFSPIGTHRLPSRATVWMWAKLVKAAT
jgi:GNAT superfamily N-acetyltransferase